MAGSEDHRGDDSVGHDDVGPLIDNPDLHLRILVVGINFSPEPTGIGPYTRAYADALFARGHEVTVITGVPHYPEWRVGDRGRDDRPYLVVRCPHFVPASPSAIGRLRYEVTFALGVRRALTTVGTFDVVLAVIPSLASAAVAASWAKRHGARRLVVIQDIVTSAARLNGPAGTALGVIGRLLEFSVLRNAARIAVISPGMTRALSRRGARADRIAITPNWPLRIHPQLDTATARVRSGYAVGDFICVHAGNMGAKQGLEVVVGAARIAQERNLDLRFVLIGDGNQRSRLVGMSHGLTHLQFRPLLSDADYDSALAGADVLLLTQRPSVLDMALPSKLTSYMGIWKPIVASVSADSVTAVELRRSGSALLVPPGDPAALLNAVLKLQADEPLSARLAQQARSYYESELDPDVLRARFVKFVEQVAEGGR